jgi:hypothetical protein
MLKEEAMMDNRLIESHSIFNFILNSSIHQRQKLKFIKTKNN